MNKQIVTGFNTTLEGAYKLAVIDKDDNVVYEEPNWKKNLILNNGMDHIAIDRIGDAFIYAISGIGIRDNYISSSASTAYVSGAYLLLTGSGGVTSFTSASHGYNATAEVGDIIRFDDGQEVTVQTTMSTTELGTSPSSSIASGSFVIWKTSQYNLAQELKRTNTYLGTGCKTLRNTLSSSYTMIRTYDFGYETSSVDITEVGVGWAAQYGGSYIGDTWRKTVFSRMNLPTTVSLVSGQKLRMYYSLTVSYGPTSPVSFSAIISGWPVAPSTSLSASQMIQKNFFLSYGNPIYFHSVVTDGTGATYASQDYSQLEPYGNHTVWISNSSASINNYGTASNRTATYATHTSRWKSNYVTNSYSLVKVGFFNEASFPRNDIRSMGMAYGAPDANVQAFTVVFDEPQSKNDTQTLTLGFRYDWRRVLA